VLARATCLAAVAAVVAACGGASDGSSPTRRAEPSGGFAEAARSFRPARALADLRVQVRIGPRPAGSPGSRREVALIVRRLRAAGAARISVQRPHRNVVARIRGRERGRTVLLGAHHDTKAGIPGFAGANDGASGVAVLLELARVLPRPLPGPGVTLAFFDAEEARGSRSFGRDGMRGSRQFVRRARAGSAGTPPLARIQAMYLLDMVGDCDLRIPREANSDERLYRLLAGPAFGGEAPGVLDDHIPFVRAGVPAVDVIDFTYGPGPSPGGWWHTPEDGLDKVCASSLGQVGRAVIGALAGLEG
jgi:hypothetical protein